MTHFISWFISYCQISWTVCATQFDLNAGDHCRFPVFYFVTLDLRTGVDLETICATGSSIAGGSVRGCVSQCQTSFDLGESSLQFICYSFIRLICFPPRRTSLMERVTRPNHPFSTAQGLLHDWLDFFDRNHNCGLDTPANLSVQIFKTWALLFTRIHLGFRMKCIPPPNRIILFRFN